MNISVEDVIKRIEDWKDKEIRYEPLGGGITNHNYIVHVDGQPFVVRIPGAGTELFIDRDNELDCAIAAGKTAVAPEVKYHLKPENISVVQYIRGKTLTTAEISSSNQLIKRIVQAIGTIHNRAVFQKVFDPFDTIRIYREYVKDFNAPLPDDIDWMLSLADSIESAMARNRPRNVACHNDYLSENFLDDGKKIWIIDWEYGGMGDPYFDLGDFAVEHPFTREQEKMIIAVYHRGENGGQNARLWRMLLHKIVSDLWWGIWAMIQHKISKIDFNFYAYGKGRFERLRGNAKDSNFETWLQEI
jgi:thiamine kinase-like enzyme